VHLNLGSSHNIFRQIIIVKQQQYSIRHYTYKYIIYGHVNTSLYHVHCPRLTLIIETIIINGPRYVHKNILYGTEVPKTIR